MKESVLISVIIACTVGAIFIGSTKESNEHHLIDESSSTSIEEQINNTQEKSRPLNYWQLQSKALEYYSGSKGTPQNYTKAEELFRQSADDGGFMAPAYISALLAFKYNKLSGGERKALAQECYFWTLIAIGYSSLSSSYSEGNTPEYHSLDSKKRFFESYMTLSEIEEIQDQATKWWEIHHL